MKKALSFLIISLFITFTTAASEGSFTKDPTCPGGMYLVGPAVGYTGNLYYSDDFGESLQTVVADTYMTGGIIGDPVPGYLISHYGAINLSTDYGVSWQYTGSTPNNISAGRYPGEIYTFFWIGFDRFIRYSTNYGGSWEIHVPFGLNTTDLSHAVGNLEGEFYVLDTDDGEIYRSINFGDTFNYMSSLPVGGGGNGTKLHKGALPGELYYFNGYTGDLYFSGDSGISFDRTYHFPDTTFIVYVRQLIGGTQSGDVFVSMQRTYYTGGGETFIYYSDDYGYNFTEFHPFSSTVGLPYINLTPLDTTAFPSSGGILEYNILGGNRGPIPYTGDIWCDVTLPDSSIYGPVMGPVQDFYFGSYWTGDRDRELTIPGGAPAGMYALNAYIGEYDPVNPIIDAEDHLIFTKSGMSESLAGDWFVDRGQSLSSTKEFTNNLPNNIELNAYPNPFNPTTTITYSVPELAFVELKIYDVSGREVASLVSEYRPPGSYQVTFEGKGLASGIYFYHLKAGDKTSVKKMVLTK